MSYYHFEVSQAEQEVIEVVADVPPTQPEPVVGPDWDMERADTDDWTGAPHESEVTFAKTTDNPHSGTQALRVTATDPESSTYIDFFSTGNSLLPIGEDAPQPAVQAWVRSSIAAEIAITAGYWDADKNFVEYGDTSYLEIDPDEWGLLVAPFDPDNNTTPAGTAYYGVYLYTDTSLSTELVLDVDDVTLG